MSVLLGGGGGGGGDVVDYSSILYPCVTSRSDLLYIRSLPYCCRSINRALEPTILLLIIFIMLLLYILLINIQRSAADFQWYFVLCPAA